MKNEIYKKMLENAGTIQYLFNIITDCETEEWWFTFTENESHFHFYTAETYPCDWVYPKWVGKFFVKGRVLRSGLATPMARRSAWRALGMSSL